ncbi:DUF4190 domain-containing protein [Bacteroidales bacterium AH-315-I05]|nr:DUF4190 domain-containing protein [Bacteroidales bacterium AH-315-I05]
MVRLKFLLLAFIFLTACNTSKDVASDSLLQKRKYRKGFFVNLKKQKSEKVVAVAGTAFLPEAKSDGIKRGKAVVAADEKEKPAELLASANYHLPEIEKKHITSFLLPTLPSDTLDYYEQEGNSSMQKALMSFFSAVGASASFVLSNIFSFFIPEVSLLFFGLMVSAAILAVIMGMKALREIKESGNTRGKGFAKAGMIVGWVVLGYITLSIILVIYLVFLLL